MYAGNENRRITVTEWNGRTTTKRKFSLKKNSFLDTVSELYFDYYYFENLHTAPEKFPEIRGRAMFLSGNGSFLVLIIFVHSYVFTKCSQHRKDVLDQKFSRRKVIRWEKWISRLHKFEFIAQNCNQVEEVLVYLAFSDRCGNFIRLEIGGRISRSKPIDTFFYFLQRLNDLKVRWCSLRTHIFEESPIDRNMYRKSKSEINRKYPHQHLKKGWKYPEPTVFVYNFAIFCFVWKNDG